MKLRGRKALEVAHGKIMLDQSRRRDREQGGDGQAGAGIFKGEQWQRLELATRNFRRRAA